MNKTAIITGITGQDGAYLAQYLLEKNYNVIGTYRHTSCPSFWRIIDLGINRHPNLKLHQYDLTDSSSIISLLEKFEPDEFYNLAAQSFVGASFTQPFTTTQITGTSVLNILEGIRSVNTKIKFYQASSSEMFGKVQAVPQNEKTSFYPRSPYAVAKLYAHWITVNYRESYDLFNCNGILFNHESPLRGAEFVTRKITDSVAKIILGKQEVLELGNLDAQRDWGFAGDYVKGMHAMLQHATPDDYVLATGVTKSVRDFVNMTFEAVDIPLEWKGHDLNEVAINTKNGKTVVKINPQFQRPAEVDLLLGDASKAKQKLGWEPQTTAEMLCDMMIKADLARNQ